MRIDPAEAKAQKRALREELRRRRLHLPEHIRAERSAQIIQRTITLPEAQEARTVHLYWPMLHRGEVDTRSLVQWLVGLGKQVVMPVTTDFSMGSPGGPRMEHRCFTSEADLVENRWGLREPVGGACVPLEDIDLVIVPALGAGRNGERIGYGRGHYDEFLRSLGAETVCLLYAECVLPQVPMEPHDVPMSIIVTENEVIRTGHVTSRAKTRSDA